MDAPEGFEVDVNYKPKGGALPLLDLLSTTTMGLAAMAPRGANTKFTTLRYAVTTVELVLRGNLKDGDTQYRYRDVFFSVRHALCWMKVNGHYGEASFVTSYRRGDSLERVGFGQFRLFANLQLGGNANVSINDTAASNGSGIVALAAQEDEIKVSKFGFFDKEQPFPPFNVYMILINTVIKLSEENGEDWKDIIEAYVGSVDLSFRMEATSVAARENLKVKYLLAAIEDLAGKLLTAPKELQFRPFTFRIRRNGAFIGRGVFRRGRGVGDQFPQLENSTVSLDQEEGVVTEF